MSSALLDKVLSRAGKKRLRQGDGSYMVTCPAHRDPEPSLHVGIGGKGQVILKCFAGCETREIVDGWGLRWSDLYDEEPDTGKPILSEKATLQTLSRYVGLQPDWLSSLGLANCTRGGVLVPYYGLDSNWLYNKVRLYTTVNRQNKKQQKYIHEKLPKGVKTTVYGEWRMDLARELRAVVLVEGESDCWTLWRHKIPALGVPGASAYGKLEKKHIKRIRQAYIVQEPGAAGAKFVQGVGQRLSDLDFTGSVKVIPMGEDKDPNQLFLKTGGEFKATFRRLCDRAPDWGDHDLEDAVLRMSDVEEKPLEWLWEPYVPAGMLTLLAGKPDSGKSFLMTAIISSLTLGGRLPNATRDHEPMNILLFAAEDDLHRTVKPRLVRCGADTSRVYAFNFMSGKDFLFTKAESFDRLSSMIERFKPGCIVFDPLVTFMGSKLDANRATEVRSVMRPLYKIASEYGIPIVMIVHVRKGHVTTAIDGIMGSVDFVAAVRSVLIAMPDPVNAGQKVLAHAKHNLSVEGKPLAYEMGDDGFRWVGTKDTTAEDLTANTGMDAGERTRFREACELIEEEVDSLGVEAKHVLSIARKGGISETTMHKARHHLGVKSKRTGFGPGASWQWYREDRGPDPIGGPFEATAPDDAPY